MIPNNAALVDPTKADTAAIPRTAKLMYLLMFIDLKSMFLKFIYASFVI